MKNCLKWRLSSARSSWISLCWMRECGIQRDGFHLAVFPQCVPQQQQSTLVSRASAYYKRSDLSNKNKTIMIILWLVHTADTDKTRLSCLVGIHRRRKQFESGGARIPAQSAGKFLLCPPLFCSAPPIWGGTAHTRVGTKLCPPRKIWRRKRAKSSISLPRIVRFHSNFVQCLDTSCQKYYKSSRSVWRNVAKIMSVGDSSISLVFRTNFDLVTRRCTTNFQGQRSRSQRYRTYQHQKIVTFHELICWPSLNFLQIIPQHSRTRDTCIRS